MKLATFSYENSVSFGIITDEGVIDLKKKLNHKYEDLKSLIEKNGIEEAKGINMQEIDYSLSDISFLPVIPNPNKIICVGVNYDEHRIETNHKKVENPTIFFRVADSQIGHQEDIILPLESSKLDYEGEIAVVIGKSGKRISEDDAFEYIAGYSCYNDGTIRDWQIHTSQWGPGKNFDGTGAFGPWMVTRDEINDDAILTLETRLNGEVMQHATTEMLLFSIRQLIHYTSSFTTLQPGDVIVTGTPGGVGNKRNPQVFMKAGDTVEVEVSQIGVLTNKIKAE